MFGWNNPGWVEKNWKTKNLNEQAKKKTKNQQWEKNIPAPRARPIFAYYYTTTRDLQTKRASRETNINLCFQEIKNIVCDEAQVSLVGMEWWLGVSCKVGVVFKFAIHDPYDFWGIGWARNSGG